MWISLLATKLTKKLNIQAHLSKYFVEYCNFAENFQYQL